MKKKISILLVMVLLIFACAGCAGSTSSNTQNGGSGGSATPSDASPSGSDRDLARLLLGTSSVGGTYYVLGGGWAKIMNETVYNVDCSVEVTGGPNTNMQLIQQDDMELGFVTTWLGGEGWSGTGWAEGVRYDKMRGMFATYYSVMYLYTLEGSGINTVFDLEGKNVSVGSPGGTSDLAARAMMEIIGVTPKSVTALTNDAQINGIKDGTIDAVFNITGIPAPFLLELETTHDVKIIPMSEDVFDTVLAEQPYWAREVIPAGTFKNQTEEVPVFAFWNMMVGHADLDDDLVYDLISATFAQQQSLIAVDPTASQTVPEAVGNCMVPLHPGALRYYQEQGIQVPEALILG